MAIDKSKQNKSKKGAKKKIDTFARKEWYDIKTPSIFKQRTIGKTVSRKPYGMRTSSMMLKNRVFSVSVGDLNMDEENSFRKIKLRCKEVIGKNCLTAFDGMEFTSDKDRSLAKKWHTKIDAIIAVKTTDGYVLRLFATACTKRLQGQTNRRSYAKSSEVKQIRKIMFDIITKEIQSVTLREAVHKILPEVIGKEIEKATKSIYPLQNVFIRKVKVAKSPKYNREEFMQNYVGGVISGGPEQTANTDFKEPPVFKSI